MPISPAQVAQDRAECTVTIGDHSGRVVFTPNALTVSDEERFAAMTADSATSIEAMGEMVCRLSVEWEVVQPDGSMWPITPEGVRLLPSRVIVAVLQGVMETVAAPVAPGESKPSLLT